MRECGLAVRVAGLRRYVALLVARDGAVRLVRRHHDVETVLARWSGVRPGPELRIDLVLVVRGDRIRGWADGALVADLVVGPGGLDGLPGAPRTGAVALVVEEGTVTVESVEVRPAPA